MEIKKPAETTKRSDQDLAICTINIDDFEQESRPSAYTCTFCKRGFSNAQALGGHMNVHRKDRAARLQESSIQETALTTKGSTNSMDHGPDDQSQSSSDDDKGDGTIAKRPWSFTEEEGSPESHRKKDHGVNFKKPSLQLSLCIEPSTTNESCIISSNKISTSLSSSPTEVDLELRLGIDSQAISINRVTRD